ncbi:hypothetical protein D3C73_989920 [compost metagenome]
MHLHRVLGQPHLIGNLLVEQAVGQAQQHPELLRRELRQTAGQQRVGLGTLGGHRREPQATIEHRCHRFTDGFGRRGLGNETGRAELLRATNHPRVVVGGQDHHRNVRVRTAHVQQRGEPMRARHGQVQQHQIHIGLRIQRRGKCFGAGDLAHLRQRQALPQ